MMAWTKEEKQVAIQLWTEWKRPTEISKILGKPPSSVSHLLRDLEKKGTMPPRGPEPDRPFVPPLGWTCEQFNKFCELHKAGYRYIEIAKITGLTKNSVAGLAKRLIDKGKIERQPKISKMLVAKLESKARDSVRVKPPAIKTVVAPQALDRINELRNGKAPPSRPVGVSASEYDREAVSSGRAKDFTAKGKCKWPVNDKPFLMCHADTVNPNDRKSQYCKHHHDRATIPTPTKKNRPFMTSVSGRYMG
jgi:hypothetical protein